MVLSCGIGYLLPCSHQDIIVLELIIAAYNAYIVVYIVRSMCSAAAIICCK